MKECDILGRGLKHTLTPYIFSGGQEPQPPMIYAPWFFFSINTFFAISI